MRNSIQYPLAVVAGVILAAGCGVCHGPGPSPAEQQQQAKIDELQAKIVKLEKKVRLVNSGDPYNRRPDFDEIEKIEFPTNPTPENLKQYIADIQSATSERYGWSDRDPQIEKLAAVGTDHLDLLLQSIRPGRQNYHLIQAINQIATEKNKDLILAALPRYPELAPLVLKFDWVKDARKTIIGQIRSSRQLNDAWLDLSVALNDKEVYPYLIAYFITCNNKMQVYQSLSRLPELNLDAAVILKAWRNLCMNPNGQWERIQFAPLVLEQGNPDALKVIFDALQSNNGNREQMRQTVLMYTDAFGSDGELVEWYRKNHDQLYFDQTAKRFKVKTPAPAGK